MAKTLRDEFAMAELAQPRPTHRHYSFSEIAESSYKVANAMMEERKKHVKMAHPND